MIDKKLSNSAIKEDLVEKTEANVIAMDSADMEIVNMIQGVVQQNTRQLRREIDESNPLNDAWFISVVIIGIASYMVKNLVLPLVEKRRNGGNGSKATITGWELLSKDMQEISKKLEKNALTNELANKAHSIITEKDGDGVPFILTIPRHLREASEVLKDVSSILKKIDSHLKNE